MRGRRAIRWAGTIVTAHLVLAVACTTGPSRHPSPADPPSVTDVTVHVPEQPMANRSDDGGLSSGGVPVPAGDDAPPPTDDASRQTTPQPASPPSVLRIEALGIEAPVVPTDTDDRGVLMVPPPEQVGWFERWPAPGDPGPAVLAGHVDSRSGPGALFALQEVQPGMTIEVERRDGSTATFRVDRVQTHPKDRFPTQEVYGEVPGTQLRVITCTGPFDATTRQYRDNLVVFAAHTAAG